MLSVAATTAPTQAPPALGPIGDAPRPAADRPSTVFLDGMRGLAAMYVVLFHARILLQEGYDEGYRLHPQSYGPWQKGLLFGLFAFRWGLGAVVFFFVLSGFVIHLRYALRVANGDDRRFGWRDFTYRRARRLYPVLAAALLLTFALDRLGLAMRLPVYFGQTRYSWLNGDFVPHLGLATLLGNLAFLMRAYCPTFGTDGVLWSLKYEWWFYMLYPLLWLALRRSVAGATAIVAVLYAATFVHWPAALVLPVQIFSLFPVWWMGVLLAEIYAGRLRVKMAWLAPLVLLLPFGVWSSGAMVEGARLFAAKCMVMGLAFTGLIAGGFAMQRRGWRLWILEKLKPMGDMSYSLYLCHLPVIVLISGWLLSRSPDGRLPRSFLWLALGVGTAVAVSAIVYWTVERPTLTRKHFAARPGYREKVAGVSQAGGS